jgi:branched-chain amino acid transport system permease protein
MGILPQLFTSGIMTGAVYGLLAVGMVIIFKCTSVLNLAHGPMMAFTCVLGWAIMVQLNMPLWVMIIGLVLIVFVLALLIERVALRPLIGHGFMIAVVATLALGEILSGIMTLLWPGAGRTFPQLIPIGAVRIGSVSIAYESLITLAICLLCLFAFMAFFQWTKWGLVMRATAEDHQLAQSGGIQITRVFAIAWFIGLLLVAIAGVLMGNMQGVSPVAIGSMGLRSLPGVMLGGLESITGAIVGSFIVGVIEIVGGGYLDPIMGSRVADVLPFVILLIILIFKPSGLFGYKTIERV